MRLSIHDVLNAAQILRTDAWSRTGLWRSSRTARRHLQYCNLEEICMKLTRKEFLRSMTSVAAGAAGAALLVACGGDEGGSADAAVRSCTTNGTTASIADNHGHTLSVPRTDVMAGTQKMYDIEATGGHSHIVTVTAAMFTMLQNNTTVMVNSAAGDTDGHTHRVTIMCV
jgi:hypothetical protein